MDIEKLIEQLNNWNEKYISALCGERKLKCEEFCLQDDCLVVRAASVLSTLQSENEKLRDEAEGMRSNWYKSVDEIQKLRAENIRWGQVASEQDKQLDRLLAELKQVIHQRDNYHMYHYELALKPNCNTCADKDCKYRPIPGDTVRANCPLWRGPKEAAHDKHPSDPV